MTQDMITIIETKYEQIDTWEITKLSDLLVAIGAMKELYTMVTSKFYHEVDFPIDNMYYNYWKDYYFDLRNMTKAYIMCLTPEEVSVDQTTG